MPLGRSSQIRGKKSDPNLINRLPSELLLEVFSIYVWTNYGSPTHLILVCKLWENIASYPALWGNIFYGDDFDGMYSVRENDLAQQMEGKGFIWCWSQESLNRAIEKTKSSTFELTVCRHHNNILTLKVDNLDNEALSQRCRLIRFISREGYLDFAPILTRTPLFSLKEFICPDSWWLKWDDTSLVTENLSKNSPVLWNMSTASFESGPAFRSLLPRLRKVYTTDINNLRSNNKDGIGVLETLEEIKIENDAWQTSPNQAQAQEPSTMPLLKKVTIEDGSLYHLPIQLYAQLTHLTLGCWRSTSAFASTLTFEGLISLPLLSYLCVEGPWHYAHHLDAPNLITLCLYCGGAPGDMVDKADAKSLENVSLTPKIIHIDKSIPQGDMLTFLSKNSQKLEELSITYVKLNETISDQVSAALVGGKRKKALCPLLRKLDIITISFDKKKQAEMDELYRATKRRLQRIVDERVSEETLTKVRHGSYPIKSEEKILYLPHRRYWAFKWVEIL